MQVLMPDPPSFSGGHEVGAPQPIPSALHTCNAADMYGPFGKKHRTSPGAHKTHAPPMQPPEQAEPLPSQTPLTHVCGCKPEHRTAPAVHPAPPLDDDDDDPLLDPPEEELPPEEPLDELLDPAPDELDAVPLSPGFTPTSASSCPSVPVSGLTVR